LEPEDWLGKGCSEKIFCVIFMLIVDMIVRKKQFSVAKLLPFPFFAGLGEEKFH